MHERTQPIPGCLRSPGSQILLLCPSLRGKRLHRSVSAVRLDRQTYGFQIIVLGPISEWLRAWARQSLITRLLLLTLDVCDSTQWWYEGPKVTSVFNLSLVIEFSVWRRSLLKIHYFPLRSEVWSPPEVFFMGALNNVHHHSVLQMSAHTKRKVSLSFHYLLL